MFRKIKPNIGSLGESLARDYLEGKGYKFQQQNYRVPGGEIDLIFEKDGILVFVEVKSRCSQKFGAPEESLTYSKIALLKKTVSTYTFKKLVRQPWRLDLITILFRNGNIPEIRHYRNIIIE